MDNSTSATATRTVFSDIFDWMMVPILILAPIGAGLIFLLSVSLSDSALDQPLSDRLRKLAGVTQELTEEERINYLSDAAWIERALSEAPQVKILPPTLTVDERLTLQRGLPTLEVSLPHQPPPRATQAVAPRPDTDARTQSGMPCACGT